MDSPELGRRFQESTRGKIVSLLRRGAQTVDDLAVSLGLTPNAIRGHLAGLERDRLVQQRGIRKGAGAGKPAVLYELHPSTPVLLSRAYPPVLATLVDAVVDELPAENSREVLRETGVRLAAQFGGAAPGNLSQRVVAAAQILETLGGDVEVRELGEHHHRIKGNGCPLSAVVCRRPEFCHAVATMLSEVAGAEARVCCTHGEVPQCCFEFGNAA